MQATRPKVLMAPLQIGLAVQLHSHFASRYIVDCLHAYGCCSSYHHVQTFEKSAACKQGVDLPVERNQFLQFVSDNVQTIDDHGTFHGMDMIATITREAKSTMVVPKVHFSMKDIDQVGKIHIHHYEHQLLDIRFIYKDLANIHI